MRFEKIAGKSASNVKNLKWFHDSSSIRNHAHQ
jgi:hypothetical protein